MRALPPRCKRQSAFRDCAMMLSSLAASGLIVPPTVAIAPAPIAIAPEPVCIVKNPQVVTSSAKIRVTDSVSIFPTTELLAFGKEFKGYKNPNTAERADLEESENRLAAPSRELPAAKSSSGYDSMPKQAFNLDSFLDEETDAEKAAKKKAAEAEKKKAENQARQQAVEREAEAKAQMQAEMEKSRASSARASRAERSYIQIERPIQPRTWLLLRPPSS